MTPSVTGSSTRAAMIDAAESLVAAKGIGGVSMRMVGEASGQKNHSAVQFHFGSWEGLLEAIVAERMGPVAAARQARLTEVDRRGDGGSVRSLVEALVEPLASHTIDRPGSVYARFLAVSYADPQWSSVARRSAEGAAFEQWRLRLDAALGHLPPALRLLRIDHIVHAVISALARWESGVATRGVSDRVRIDDLIATSTAFLTAPAPQTAPARRRATASKGS